MNPRTIGMALVAGAVALLSLAVACEPGSGDEEAVESRFVVDWQGPGEIIQKGENLYSQNKEELIIRDFFNDHREGFFVDIGAAWPIMNSTTYYLEKHLGWSGIAVDALSKYGPGWKKERPKSKFFNYAISDRSGETVTFYRHAWSEVSSLSKEYSAQFGGEENVTAVEVETVTLNDLLDHNGVTKIDHLTIDIEGAEMLALNGFDIQRFKPALVCIEVHGRGAEGAKEIAAYFEANGYRLLEAYAPYEFANWFFAPR